MIFSVQGENERNSWSGTELNKYQMIFLSNDHLISKILFDDWILQVKNNNQEIFLRLKDHKIISYVFRNLQKILWLWLQWKFYVNCWTFLHFYMTLNEVLELFVNKWYVIRISVIKRGVMRLYHLRCKNQHYMFIKWGKSFKASLRPFNPIKKYIKRIQ